MDVRIKLVAACLAILLPSAAAEELHFIPGTFDPTLGPDGNSVVFTAPTGLVVIDTGRHPAHARRILDFATAAHLPIVAVVNTHWHLDHTTGNLDVKAAYPAARVYATRAIDGALEGFLAGSIEASRNQRNDPTIDAARRARSQRFLAAIDEGALIPDLAVGAPQSIPLAGRDLELHVTHYAVTGSDLWIWDPETRTVIAGDLVTLPVPLFDTGCAVGWRAALDEIGALPFQRVVPGHGYIMTADEFRLYRKAFHQFIACADERSGAECADGWLVDAAPLLDRAAGEDYADKDYARAAAEYYVDEVMKPADRQRSLCSKAQ